MASIVTSANLFFGWSETELATLLQKIKADIQVRGLDWINAYTINGKTFNKSERLTLRDCMRELRKALRELDPTIYGEAAPKATTADFSNLQL